MKAYCADPDPNSSLNIGTLTLTKLREAFRVFKEMVVEAQRSSGNGSSGDSSSGSYNGAVTSSQTDEAINKQVADLKSCLLQRDNEIAILVNMVKKGKTAEDVGMASRGASRPKLGDSVQSSLSSEATSQSQGLSASAMSNVFSEKAGKYGADSGSSDSGFNTTMLVAVQAWILIVFQSGLGRSRAVRHLDLAWKCCKKRERARGTEARSYLEKTLIWCATAHG